ncbi:MAG: sulfatase/phosphatase domain-containing protein, partial [Halomonas sp.]
HNVYEDILNVPLIIRYPAGFKGDRRVEDLVSLIDIFPTLTELAGIDMPELKHEIQGVSLVDLLAKNKRLKRDYVVSENWSHLSRQSDNNTHNYIKEKVPVNQRLTRA